MKSGMKVFSVILMIVAVLALGIVLVGFGSGKDIQPAGSAAVQPVSEPELAATVAEEAGGYALPFSTTALDGSPVDQSIMEGKSLVMLNFWEPWCGPCVSEMPDLQRISEEYSDKGFLIVGVYSTENGTQEIVDKLGISYPIIRNCDAFQQFVTGYVPTTAFVDGDGNVLGELIVGGRSYDDWKEIIDSFLA